MIWGYKDKKKKAEVDYDPWVYDPESGVIKRYRDLNMPIKEAMIKTASFYEKLGDDFTGDKNLFDDTKDPLVDDGLDKFGPEKSTLLDQTAPMTTPIQPSEELLFEKAYMVIFSQWGWDEYFRSIGKDTVEGDYLKWAEELHAANRITNEDAAALTDLLFFDELEAKNFIGNAKGSWGIGDDLISMVTVTLVPVSDSRVQDITQETGLTNLDLGEFLGKVTMNNNEKYYVFRNNYV